MYSGSRLSRRPNRLWNCAGWAAAAMIFTFALSIPSRAVTSDEILNRVKEAEAGVTCFRAQVVLKAVSKSALSDMGSGYENLARLKQATVYFMKPDKIRFEGYAYGIKAAYIQNAYTRLVRVSLYKQRKNAKDQPGKLQNSLDLGFLSSRLWKDNYITVVGTDADGLKLKLDPKFDAKSERHELVWIDEKTLRVLKRERYRADGELRTRIVNESFGDLGGKLPIAMTASLYDAKNKRLGVVQYRNLRLNCGLDESLFDVG